MEVIIRDIIRVLCFNGAGKMMEWETPLNSRQK